MINLSRTNKISISTKIILLTGLLIASTSLVTALYVIRTDITNSYAELIDKGNSIALIMADNLEYGVYTENQESLEAIIKGLDRTPEIIYTRILNADRKVLFESIEKAPAQIPQIDYGPDSDSKSGNAVRQYDRYIDIVTPITSVQDSSQGMLFPDTRQGLDKKNI